MPSPQIKIYEGAEGLRELNWNSLEAQDQIWIFETAYSSLEFYMSEEDSIEYRMILLEKKIKIKQLINSKIYEFDAIPGFIDLTMNTRYITPEKFTVDRDIMFITTL